MGRHAQQDEIGIYLHWPFCQSKCPYCDFNSHVAAKTDQRRWARAFVANLESYKQEFPDRVVKSVFFGGGTPSLMAPELVETLIMCIGENWNMSRDVEITLEANPNSVEARKFQDFRGAGVNRISLGIQSLNDGDLRRLGRLHTADEALKALEIAQKTFLRVSFDLIYARQNQSLADWQTELKLALSFGTEHLSLYQLTIEPVTAFGKLHNAGQLKGLPDDDLAADMYALTQQLCEQAGLPAYEVSNHAMPWAQSRHNLIYWRGGDYLGIGPGAHGRLTRKGNRFATETELSPESWLTAADSGRFESARTPLSARDQAIEYLLMSFRSTEGTDLEYLDKLDNTMMNMSNVYDLRNQGVLDLTNSRVIASKSGRMILNHLLREMIND